jgi:O-glycosyl hydrolase
MKLLFLTGCLAAISLAATAQSKPALVFTLHLNDTVQRIRNIGASGCWFTEDIGTKWPAVQKQRIAKLLFSRSFDKRGKPEGIGLSAFRYNIGAGTAEQGDSSGIPEADHRVECFLSPGGTYHWDKQAGYTWMLRQAKNYGVENLIAFVNSPPVQFTRNGLGYKLNKDYAANLGEDKYDAYADFLTEVIKHFDKMSLHFTYISPVNEPQWDWSSAYGHAKQEGSPWTNEEIYPAVQALSTSLDVKNLDTKILITEAGMLNFLYEGGSKTSRQAANFWGSHSALYIGGLSHATPFMEGHGYFTENGDAQMITTRNKLRDTLKKYGPGLEYWQSEYCMLSDGFKEGSKQGRSAMDCALFLAKVIHTDFTEGNATAWHYWNAYEPGSADSNTRYYLIALNPRRNIDTSKLFAVTKNLWALGHYSLFVRPGMYRIQTGRSDGLGDIAATQQVMASAFRDSAGKQLVVNVINYTTEEQHTTFVVDGLTHGENFRLDKRYVTSAKEGDDMKPYPVEDGGDIVLPARSITSLLFGLQPSGNKK